MHGARRAVTPWAVALVGVLQFGGCASTPKKTTVDPEPVIESKHKAVDPLAKSTVVDDGMKVSGLVGTLDPAGVQNALARTMPAASQCYHEASRRQPYLGGSMSMKFIVQRDGSVKKLQLLSSDVGNYEVERCVLQKLGATRFEQPRGGAEAEFTYPLTFPARMTVLQWEEKDIRKTMEKWRRKLRKRSRRRKEAALPTAPRGLLLTLYVGGDGHLRTLGMVAEEEIDQEFPTKLVEALRKVKFKAPPTRMAKVRYRW